MKRLLMTGTKCGLYTSRDCNLSLRELSQEELGRFQNSCSPGVSRPWLVDFPDGETAEMEAHSQ